MIGSGGILPGKELAFTFGTLRANDLIWPYVVNNYLKGETHDAFDLLFWDSDSVNLPGPMYCWYTRNTYLENNIKQPGKTTQCGTPVDLSKINAPAYVLASSEDHIVPWKSAYQTKICSAAMCVCSRRKRPCRRRHQPAGEEQTQSLEERGPRVDAQTWFDSAEEHPGSWWPDWDSWMKNAIPERSPRRHAG